MPIYEYLCQGGHKQEEFFFTVAEASECVLVTCHTCGLQMVKVMSKPQAPRMGKQSGFISQGHYLKKNVEKARQVRDVYSGDDLDGVEIVK